MRRSSDPRSNFYSDRPSAPALLVVGLIFGLCVLDGVLSLRLFELEKSEELNPLLALVLNFGNAPFMAFKLALTAISLLVILLHWNFCVFNKVRTVTAAYWLVGTYIVVVFYSTGLLWW
ncbi:MAG TPA: DUF5658 family protein [Acidobacteriota bacterium]|nr:DUF5658 family protein [Acidobacteriota bacterium]